MVGGMLAGTSGFTFLPITLDPKTGLFGADIDTVQAYFFTCQNEIVSLANIGGHCHLGFSALQVEGDRFEG